MTKPSTPQRPPRIPKITTGGNASRRLTKDERDYLAGKSRTVRESLERAHRPAGAGVAYGLTPEHRAKVADVVEDETVIPAAGPVKAVKRQRIVPAIDHYKQYFNTEELETFRRFVMDAERATTVNLTIAYDGLAGSAPGPRRGGVSDRNRSAHARFEVLKGALPGQCMEICKNLVLAVRADRMDRAMTMHEVAQSHAPHLKRKDALGCYGAGLLKATAWMLQHVYRNIDKGTRPDSELMVQLWSERRARAETGSRERSSRIIAL